MSRQNGGGVRDGVTGGEEGMCPHIPSIVMTSHSHAYLCTIYTCSECTVHGLPVYNSDTTLQ